MEKIAHIFWAQNRENVVWMYYVEFTVIHTHGHIIMQIQPVGGVSVINFTIYVGYRLLYAAVNTRTWT